MYIHEFDDSPEYSTDHVPTNETSWHNDLSSDELSILNQNKLNAGAVFPPRDRPLMRKIVTERAHTLAEAEATIDQYFSGHSITVRLDRYGDPLSSTVATLTFTDLPTDEHVGCGKGYVDEARVGAKFEAYEHAMGPIGLRAATILANYDEVRAQPAMADVFPMTLLDRPSPGIAAIPFTDIGLINGAPLLYPSFLVDYTYSARPLPGDGLDYTAARRYACGTGLAAGLGFTEAAIHATSEVIEHHGIGRLIAQTLFYQLNDSLDFVEPHTVPPALAAVWEDAERAIRAPVHLIAVGCEIDCPVFIKVGRDSQKNPPHLVLSH
ncbi:YcaO-like family protein [Burkholderia ambifaria]|uniref:YcaO domain-containing protein n=1 Tax=Burkholderia ambifaria MEX-5 TaxID=396597 RepID=B1T0M9_9BURK|nr:YcaO-like family protein [Burkholderia ambifaria]EDT42854.1 hypothetical protein BamMEX5DRAFT_1345 [Burkholderia ambifaria MEX-5]